MRANNKGPKFMSFTKLNSQRKKELISGKNKEKLSISQSMIFSNRYGLPTSHFKCCHQHWNGNIQDYCQLTILKNAPISITIILLKHKKFKHVKIITEIVSIRKI